MNRILDYEVTVIGAGMAGVCAALAAARAGRRTLLVQDRPVPGGNAGGEIGVRIQGADELGHYRYSRETGILNEIFERNAAFPNPFESPSILSLVLWRMLREEATLTVMYNCSAFHPTVENQSIVSVELHQSTTEFRGTVRSALFIDCSGDGRIAAEAGAEFLLGREDKTCFGEELAPDRADLRTMGSTVYFKVRDAGRPVPFRAPDWAPRFESDADFPGALADCPHSLAALTGTTGGYWWIEYGGELDSFRDAEEVRDALYGYALGVWDHIKNRGEHGAENFVLESIGSVPGRRESRRFLGDYVLTQQDIESLRIFPDAVAYGGWHLDLHHPKGITASPERYWNGRLLQGRYTIPYRSLYSRDIANLLLAGRNISASHVAFGSTRVMATCALMGQAAGNAAALCLENSCTPRQLNERIGELQQRLLEQDCYLPGVARSPGALDPDRVEATSEALLHLPEGDGEYEIPGAIAQSFLCGETAPERAHIRLVNRSGRTAKVRVSLYAGRCVDDFTATEPLRQRDFNCNPGEESFEFAWGAGVLEANRSYFLLLETDSGGIFCPYTRAEFPATQAGKREGQVFEPERKFIRRIRGTFGIRLQPETGPFGAAQVLSGINRTECAANLWISADGLPQSLVLEWDKPTGEVSGINAVFDNQLDRTFSEWCAGGVAPSLVKHFRITAQLDGEEVTLYENRDNAARVVRCDFGRPVRALTRLTVTVLETHGAPRAAVVSLRVR